MNVVVSGYVAGEPKVFDGSTKVLTFSIPETTKYNGNERTTWFNLKAFGKTAEFLEGRLQKKSFGAFTCNIQENAWVNKEGVEVRNTEYIIQNSNLCWETCKKRESSNQEFNKGLEKANKAVEDDSEDLPY